MTFPTAYIWAARVEYPRTGFTDAIPLYFENRPTAEEFLRYVEKEFLANAGLPSSFNAEQKELIRAKIKSGDWYCNKITVIDN